MATKSGQISLAASQPNFWELFPSQPNFSPAKKRKLPVLIFSRHHSCGRCISGPLTFLQNCSKRFLQLPLPEALAICAKKRPKFRPNFGFSLARGVLRSFCYPFGERARGVMCIFHTNGGKKEAKLAIFIFLLGKKLAGWEEPPSWSQQKLRHVWQPS